jgi:hypothetical protein
VKKHVFGASSLKEVTKDSCKDLDSTMELNMKQRKRIKEEGVGVEGRGAGAAVVELSRTTTSHGEHKKREHGSSGEGSSTRASRAHIVI